MKKNLYPFVIDRTQQRLHRLLADHYNLKYDHYKARISKALNVSKDEITDVLYGKETPNHKLIREHISKVLGVEADAIFPKVRHIDIYEAH